MTYGKKKLIFAMPCAININIFIACLSAIECKIKCRSFATVNMGILRAGTLGLMPSE